MSDLDTLVRKIVREEMDKSGLRAIVARSLAQAFQDASRALLGDSATRDAVKAQAKLIDNKKSNKRKAKKNPDRSGRVRGVLQALFDRMKAGDEFKLTSADIAKSQGVPERVMRTALALGSGSRLKGGTPANVAPVGMQITSAPRKPGEAGVWTIRRTA